MSKQRKPVPQRPQAARQQTARASASSPAVELPDFFRNTLLQSGLIFAFAFLLYANTLTHGFVLDDAIVITDNMYTSKGVEGIPGILSKETFYGFFKVEGKETLVSGGRYRPMTLVLFAMVYQVAGASPFIFHLLTVLLFAATCVVLYRTLLLLLTPRGNDYAALFAWLATLIFAAHPIHTEVVANIKGCDEIVTLLGSLGTLYFTFRAFDTARKEVGHYCWTDLFSGLPFQRKCRHFCSGHSTCTVGIPLGLCGRYYSPYDACFYQFSGVFYHSGRYSELEIRRRSHGVDE